eukprot:COSAG01_NODE_74983_length_199_cov_44.380000_1_plen_27_part_10
MLVHRREENKSWFISAQPHRCGDSGSH